MNHYYYLFSAIGMTVVAQLLLKYSSTKQYQGARVVLNVFNILAYSILFVVTVLWVKALQGIPLTIATAWISLTYMLVVITSVVIFKEGDLARKMFACFLIASGVVIFEV